MHNLLMATLGLALSGLLAWFTVTESAAIYQEYQINNDIDFIQQTGEQLSMAASIYYAEKGTWPTKIGDLITGGYVKSTIPVNDNWISDSSLFAKMLASPDIPIVNKYGWIPNGYTPQLIVGYYWNIDTTNKTFTFQSDFTNGLVSSSCYKTWNSVAVPGCATTTAITTTGSMNLPLCEKFNDRFNNSSTGTRCSIFAGTNDNATTIAVNHKYSFVFKLPEV